MSYTPTPTTAPGNMWIEIRRSGRETVIDTPDECDSRRTYATPASMIPIACEQRWLANQLKTAHL